MHCGKRGLALLAILASAPTIADMTLALRGKPAEYAIVVPADAGECLRYAAEELRDFTEQMTGVRLPIASGIAAGGASLAVVRLPPKTPATGLRGESYVELSDNSAGGPPASRQTVKPANSQPAKPAEAVHALGADGFRIAVSGDALRILGGGERGVLYGVYELLERFAGCRWYSSWHSRIPRLERFAVPEDLDETQIPAFDMREPFWYDVRRHTEFEARLRVNGHKWGTLAAKFGGDDFRFGGGLASAHTFRTLLPSDEYFDVHPEYFSLVKGKRLKERSQLCLTNPDVLRIVTSNVLDRIRRDPGAKFYGVSQNDWGNWCECPACRAVDDEEGSHAGTVIRFVNAVAEAVEREFPDAVIETLAYTYTRKAPEKTRPRRNVVPCLCTIECDFSRPIGESRFGQNVSFRSDISAWGRVADAIYLWDYTTDFANFPMPFANVTSLQGNLKFFRDNKVRMIFSQGDQKGAHAEFAELKAWLLAKLMWNPDQPLEPLLDDFMDGYYGRAMPYVRQYYDELHRRQRVRGVPLLIYDDVFNPALSDEFLDWAAEMWGKAEEAVKDDPATSYNVRMGAFSVDYMRLERLLLKQGSMVLQLDRAKSESNGMDLAKVLAKSLLRRMEEARSVGGEIRLCEGGGRNEARLASWRLVAEGGWRSAASIWNGESASLAYSELFGRGGIGDSESPGRTWDFADDGQAEEGRTVKLHNTHHDWCARFPMRRVEFVPGAAYRLRARVRVDKAGSGEAFSAGIYDFGSKVRVGEISVRAENAPSGYAWYDIATFRPNDSQDLWFAPGKDHQAAINAVYIDRVEFVRAE